MIVEYLECNIFQCSELLCSDITFMLIVEKFSLCRTPSVVSGPPSLLGSYGAKPYQPMQQSFSSSGYLPFKAVGIYTCSNWLCAIPKQLPDILHHGLFLTNDLAIPPLQGDDVMMCLLHTVNREILVSTKCWICNFCVQIFSGSRHLFENLRHWKFSITVLNFLRVHGITGCLLKLNLLQRSCQGHDAFAVAIAYGIQLLEREPHNEEDRYRCNRYTCSIASDRQHITI